jgi:hypothetical protein
MSSSLRQRTKPAASSSRAHSGHSHSHSHSHGEEEAAALVSALKGSSDPGSRITLIGLGANVSLTCIKGVAGWVLGSAALLADAAHSGSDLIADVVTLTTYRMSRRPVSLTHPYGYGSEFGGGDGRVVCVVVCSCCFWRSFLEYESLGSLVVSFLLIGTALGIGSSLFTSLPPISSPDPHPRLAHVHRTPFLPSPPHDTIVNASPERLSPRFTRRPPTRPFARPRSARRRRRGCRSSRNVVRGR